MDRLARLVEELEARPRDADRVSSLRRWLAGAGADPREAEAAGAWLVAGALAAGHGPGRPARVPMPALRAAAAEFAAARGQPRWVFDAGVDAAAEVADGLALMLPGSTDAAPPAGAAQDGEDVGNGMNEGEGEGEGEPAPEAEGDPSPALTPARWLADWTRALREAAPAAPGDPRAAAARRAAVTIAQLARLDDAGARRWALRAAAGLARPVVTPWQWVRALAAARGLEPRELAWRLHEAGLVAPGDAPPPRAGGWPRPGPWAAFSELGDADGPLAGAGAGPSGDRHPGGLLAEMRWPGWRLQLVRHGDALAAWHVDGELLDARLPAEAQGLVARLARQLDACAAAVRRAAGAAGGADACSAADARAEAEACAVAGAETHRAARAADADAAAGTNADRDDDRDTHRGTHRDPPRDADADIGTAADPARSARTGIEDPPDPPARWQVEVLLLAWDRRRGRAVARGGGPAPDAGAIAPGDAVPAGDVSWHLAVLSPLPGAAALPHWPVADGAGTAPPAGPHAGGRDTPPAPPDLFVNARWPADRHRLAAPAARDEMTRHGATGRVLRLADAPHAGGWVRRAPRLCVRALLQYLPADWWRGTASPDPRALAAAEAGLALWAEAPDVRAAGAAGEDADLAAAVLPLGRVALSPLDPQALQALHAAARARPATRFGPVAQMAPWTVVEVAFEAVRRSRRHRAGVVLEGARLLAWRPDLPPELAEPVDALRRLAGIPAAR